jgi:hypothetical protein
MFWWLKGQHKLHRVYGEVKRLIGDLELGIAECDAKNTRLMEEITALRAQALVNQDAEMFGRKVLGKLNELVSGVVD